MFTFGLILTQNIHAIRLIWYKNLQVKYVCLVFITNIDIARGVGQHMSNLPQDLVPCSDTDIWHFPSRRRFQKLQYVFRIINNYDCPRQLIGYLVKRSERHFRSLRDQNLLDLPLFKSKCGQTTLKFSAAKHWNSLPREIRDQKVLSHFEYKLFKYFMNMDKVAHICSV